MLRTLSLCLLFASCGHAQSAPASAPLRTLIVSGGPNYQNNQYAIESNARYLENLTAKARWRRVLFADGKANSRTIAAVQKTPRFLAGRVLASLIEQDLPDAPIGAQASGLGRIDGSSTKPAVGAALAAFARPQGDERGLLYFTGHGSAGQKRGGSPDYQNTTFALWNNDDISTRELSSALKNWPAKNPLVVVMVQCHSGGFANLIFQNGDPTQPVLDRDIAGFFASTGQRAAAGCTPEVDERDYQDFTTHFFAALSGKSRDGRKVTGADYDRNGAVSMSEAFAWANVHDVSIDVPVSTSDAYLRAIYPRPQGDWMKTPYSTVLSSAQPWQKALLNELSSALELRGETRLTDADKARTALKADESEPELRGVNVAAIEARVGKLQAELKRRFPGLKAPVNSNAYRRAHSGALTYLMARPAEVAAINGALDAYEDAYGASEVRDAMLERFLRAAHTIVLQNRLIAEGTPQQQAVFARLRRSEGRNPLT